MKDRLLNACAAVALILGGWGGALASAVCRHAAGPARASEHACCRARTKTKVRRASHSSSHTSSPSSSHVASRGATGQAGHCHARGSASVPVGPEAGGSEARTDGEPREVARAAAGPRAGFARQTAPCGHCVWRSETPPASARVRDREGPRRADEAPAAGVRLAAAPAAFPRVAATPPARAAPPGATRLHVLINCFLI